MAAAMNGMALHGGIIPYGGTFLIFSDYCRPAIRLAALMRQRVIFVMTHDSIGLGEDGPTHQPVEQLAALRAIPNLAVYRPADAVGDGGVLAARAARPRRPEPDRADPPECRAGAARLCWRRISAPAAPMRSRRPTAMPTSASSPPARKSASPSRRRSCWTRSGMPARVVSVPCFERFAAQDEAYREPASSATRRSRSASRPPCGRAGTPIIGTDGIFVGMHSVRRERALRGSLPAFRHHR